jgi:hypothetical protein
MSAAATPVVPIMRHDGESELCGTYVPEDDSPPIIMVGAKASEQRIANLAQRHRIDVRMLLTVVRKGGAE